MLFLKNIFVCIKKNKQIHTKHSLRVRYGETDARKHVYYGNYAEYLEVARELSLEVSEFHDDEIEKLETMVARF